MQNFSKILSNHSIEFKKLTVMIITGNFEPLLVVLWHKSYRIKQITPDSGL